jgi:hypothetical protein
MNNNYVEPMEITSEWFSEVVVVNNERFIVEGRFFIDNSDAYWYRYDDIIEFLEMDDRIADKLYKSTSNIDRMEAYDRNSYDSHGCQRTLYNRFISGDAVRRLIERHSNRQSAFIKVLNIVEFKCDSNSLYEEDDELSDLFKDFQKAVEYKDYELLTECSYNWCKSESGKDMLDKNGIVSRDTLDLFDLMLDDIESDLDNIKEVKITKSHGNKEKEITYNKDKYVEQGIKWVREMYKK